MWRSLHAKAHTNISDSVCKDLYSTQRTYHIIHLFNSVKRRARISFWKLFSFTSVYIKKKITMLTRILASSVRIIPWTLWSPFLSFFITGGILCACNRLTKIHKSYKKRYNYIYIYIYICRALWNPFKFFPNSILFFSKFIFFRFNFSRFRFFPFSFYGLLFNDQIKLYLSKSMSNSLKSWNLYNLTI